MPHLACNLSESARRAAEAHHCATVQHQAYCSEDAGNLMFLSPVSLCYRADPINAETKTARDNIDKSQGPKSWLREKDKPIFPLPREEGSGRPGRPKRNRIFYQPINPPTGSAAAYSHDASRRTTAANIAPGPREKGESAGTVAEYRRPPGMAEAQGARGAEKVRPWRGRGAQQKGRGRTMKIFIIPIPGSNQDRLYSLTE